MASCVRNICTKNYQNPIIGFQVTVENVGDAFLGHSVILLKSENFLQHFAVASIAEQNIIKTTIINSDKN